MAAHARYADLVIVGQAENRTPRQRTTPSDLAETVAISGRAAGADRAPYRRGEAAGKDGAAGAGTARSEAARAATGALPILKTADKVIVLLIDPRNDGDASSRVPASPDGLSGTA